MNMNPAERRGRWPAALWLAIIVAGFAAIFAFDLGLWAWIPWTIVAVVFGLPTLKRLLFGHTPHPDD